MRLRHIGISLAVLSFAGWAPIVSAQESREDKFRAWDSNHDGLLSMGEMQQNQANFRAMGCNHDGYLAPNEFVNRYQCGDQATAAPPAIETAPQVALDDFGRMDANRDGVLRRGEWTGDETSFRRYDRNRDGVITRD